MAAIDRSTTLTTERYDYMESPSKRRRVGDPASMEIPIMDRVQSNASGFKNPDDIDRDANISLSATSESAGKAVAPFLAKHIPDQYAPLGGPNQSSDPEMKKPNTKYCYRHRPDLKCRRQANEPSMDQLQHVSSYSDTDN